PISSAVCANTEGLNSYQQTCATFGALYGYYVVVPNGGIQLDACTPAPTDTPTPSPTVQVDYLCEIDPTATGWPQWGNVVNEACCDWMQDWVEDGASPFTSLGNNGILGMCGIAPLTSTFDQTCTETAIAYRDYFGFTYLQDPDYHPSCSAHSRLLTGTEENTTPTIRTRVLKKDVGDGEFFKSATKEAKARGLDKKSKAEKKADRDARKQRQSDRVSEKLQNKDVGDPVVYDDAVPSTDQADWQ
ncbi:MAG: hypothetical protein ACTSUE_23485, partial [Promethearchaeota archaeon]